jgi:hypothetical protein
MSLVGSEKVFPEVQQNMRIYYKYIWWVGGLYDQFSINQSVNVYYLIYQTYTGYNIRRLEEEGIIKQCLLFF